MRVLREVRPVLKPGGVFALAVVESGEHQQVTSTRVDNAHPSIQGEASLPSMSNAEPSSVPVPFGPRALLLVEALPSERLTRQELTRRKWPDFICPTANLIPKPHPRAHAATQRLQLKSRQANDKPVITGSHA